MKMVIGAAAIFLVLMVLSAVLIACAVMEKLFDLDGAPDYV